MLEPEFAQQAVKEVGPRSPWMTYGVIAISLFVFVAQALEGEPVTWEDWRRWGVLSAWDIYEGGVWALLTSVFVHADFLHVAFNVYWLWILGRALEQVIGSLRWLGFFVAAAWVSSAAELAVSGETGIGLSGVGYALFGFMCVTRSRYESFRQVIDRNVVLVFLIGLVFFILATRMEIMNIGNMAHIAGLVFGAYLGSAALPHRRLVGILATLILLLASTTSVFWAPWSADWTALRARNAKERGDLDAALAGYTRVIELDDEYGWAYGRRGWIRIDRGEYAEAVVDFTRVIELDPAAADAFDGRGLAWRLMEDYDAAIADLTLAIRFDPSDVFAYDERGWAHNGKEEYEEAIIDFTKAIELDDGYTWAYCGRGHARRKMGDHAASIEDFRKAIDLDAAYTLAHYELGIALYRLGDWKASLMSIEKSMSLDDGGDVGDWFLAAMNQWQLGEKLAAREWYAEALHGMDDDIAEWVRFRAEAEELMGETEK